MALGGSTHFFHAHAHALGGRFTRPFSQPLNAQAATSLPVSGGYGSAHVDNFRFEHLLSFRSASSQVAGSHHDADGSHTTLATSIIEGLNVLDMVTADRVVARLSIHHPPDHGESTFVFLGSRFENLVIAGFPVHVEMHPHLSTRYATSEDFKKHALKDKDLCRIAREGFQCGSKSGLPESEGRTLCSLALKIQVSSTELSVRGHVIVVPDFGAVHLAELMIDGRSRHLTMLRLVLGSPVGGEFDGGGVGGNGTTYP